MPRKRIADEPNSGAGPWVFEVDETLTPGESYLLDFENMKYRKKKRYFKQYLPLDQAQVTNLSSSAPVTVEYNGVYDQFVTANTSESFDDAGVVRMLVTNASSSVTIDPEEVVIEVVSEPFDADDLARERKEQGPLAAVVENFTGLGI